MTTLSVNALAQCSASSPTNHLRTPTSASGRSRLGKVAAANVSRPDHRETATEKTSLPGSSMDCSPWKWDRM